MSDNPQRIAELIQQGKKLEAIKLLRETTGVSLQEAKEQVERLMIESTTGVAPAATPNPNAPISKAVQDLARSGKKIEAIKQLRVETGLGLREAKERVDALMEEQGMKAGGSGCAGMILMMVIAMASAAWVMAG